MNWRRELGLAGAALALVLLGGAVLPGDTPLLDATRRGDVAAVRSLLKDGADPDVAEGDGLTALHLAAQEGNLEIAKLLIGGGANVEAKTRIGASTPLHLASAGAHTSVVLALINSGADPGAVTTATGATPLHLAAKALNGEGAVKALLERGVQANARDNSAGQTPLMFAAAYGRAASARVLLSHGADPGISTNVVDVLRRMVIDREAQKRLGEALVDIRKSSPDGTDRALTPSEVKAAVAVQREFLRSGAQIEELLEDFNPDDVANRVPAWTTQGGLRSEAEILRRPMMPTLVDRTGGMTALLLAARDGHIEAAEAMVDGGADIDQASGDGSTPLVLALLNGQFDLAMVLIERGANSNKVSYDGVSPLFAVLQTQWSFNYSEHPHPRAQDDQQTEHMQVLNALLQVGADPNVPLKTHLWFSEYFAQKLGLDLTGATPFWRAALALDVEAMKALIAHGADPDIPARLPETRHEVSGTNKRRAAAG